MSKARFSIISQCTLEVPRNQIIAPETEEIGRKNLRIELPVYCVYVEHPQIGKILFDTGVSENREETWSEYMKAEYRVKNMQSLEKKLKELGTAPEEIDLLILSHLHYDHVGNVRLFQGTKAGRRILISRAEGEEAFGEGSTGVMKNENVYRRAEYDGLTGIGYERIDWDAHLADGLDLFIQSGHTKGVIGMRIETEKSGTYLFCSDACYTAYHFGPPARLPGLVERPEDYKKNMEKLRKMQERDGAKMIFAHDIEDFAKWEKSPYLYE